MTETPKQRIDYALNAPTLALKKIRALEDQLTEAERQRDDMKPITVGIDRSSDAIAEAERRGAEWMRERVAIWHLANASRSDCPVNFGALHERCARAIRALPLREGDE